MKIDFHTHGKLAKKLPYSFRYTQWLFEEARGIGLDAICLTEHFNTLQFKQMYEDLNQRYPKVGDTWFADGLTVFPGMEVDVAEGGHILIIGNLIEINRLHAELANHMLPESFIGFDGLMDLLTDRELIAGAAHPYRIGSKLHKLSHEQLMRLDFLDLNGKDIAELGVVVQDLVYQLAAQIDLPVIGGSDTHQAFQYGCIYNRSETFFKDVRGMKAAIRAGSLSIEIAPDIAYKVRTAGMVKRAMKEVDACGGDYLSLISSGESA